MNQKTRVTNFVGKLAKKLIMFCYEEKIVNPSITLNIEIRNGERYKLVFERIDLGLINQDENLKS